MWFLTELVCLVLPAMVALVQVSNPSRGDGVGF